MYLSSWLATDRPLFQALNSMAALQLSNMWYCFLLIHACVNCSRYQSIGEGAYYCPLSAFYSVRFPLMTAYQWRETNPNKIWHVTSLLPCLWYWPEDFTLASIVNTTNMAAMSLSFALVEDACTGPMPAVQLVWL